MNKKSNKDYDKKIDNELKKKEIEKKYGASFSKNSALPPEMESEWLDNIEKFEEQYRNAEQIPLWHYIGKPSFKKIEELQKDDIPVELQRLYDILGRYNISLDALDDVDDAELYRFITEELFIHEMDNIWIEGMMTGFIYEEFHPNADEDIRRAFDYLFRMTFAKMKNIGGDGYDLLYIDTENYLDSDSKKLSEKTVTSKINTFLDSFDTFEIVSNKIKSVIINEEKTDSQLNFEIHYNGCFANSPEKVTYKGDGILKLKPSEHGGWDIYQINLPGLEI